MYSNSSHIVIYIILRSCFRLHIIRSFEPIKTLYFYTSYRTYSVTIARQTYNLKEKCSNSLRVIIISV